MDANRFGRDQRLDDRSLVEGRKNKHHLFHRVSHTVKSFTKNTFSKGQQLWKSKTRPRSGKQREDSASEFSEIFPRIYPGPQVQPHRSDEEISKGIIHDIRYGYSHRKQTLRLFLPTEDHSTSPLAVVMYIRGTKCMQMPESTGSMPDYISGTQQYAVAIVDCRINDLVKAVKDCKAAVR